MPATAPLVLVTRTREQSAGLVRALTAAGAEVIEFPVIDIEPLPPPAVVPRADWLVFVSRNAVHHGLPVLGERLARARVAAVGSGTAAALAAAGVEDVLVPPTGAPAGGAGLLASPELASLDGQVVLVVRGVGGREELAAGLRARGAAVDYLEVYRRGTGSGDGAALARLCEGGRRPVVVVTSSEGARNFFDIAGAGLVEWLRELPYATIAPRVAETLRARGARREPVVSTDTDDDALAAAALRAAVAERPG